MNNLKVLACSGGGIRCLATAGALMAAEAVGIDLQGFDYYTGDSSGSLIAALCANGWTGREIAELLINTDIPKLVTPLPWAVRKPLILAKPIRLEGMARFFDSLDLKPEVPLVINSWDAEDNVQTLFCETLPEDVNLAGTSAVPTRWQFEAFSDLGYGTILTRSMALPGLLADSTRWMDGALGEHPPLSWLPAETELTLINLGFSGLVEKAGDSRPKHLIERALYAYEVTATVSQNRGLARFNNPKVIDPKIYDVDSIAFDLKPSEKKALVRRAFTQSLPQWEAYDSK